MFASIFQRVKILTEVLPAVQSLIPSRTKYTYSRKKVCGVWNKRSGKPIKKNQRPVEENEVRFLSLYTTRFTMSSDIILSSDIQSFNSNTILLRK